MKITNQEIRKSLTSNTDNSNTEYNKKDLIDWAREREEYEWQIKKNIEYLKKERVAIIENSFVMTSEAKTEEFKRKKNIAHHLRQDKSPSALEELVNSNEFNT